MIGNQIGAGREKTAYIYAKRFALLGVTGRFSSEGSSFSVHLKLRRFLRSHRKFGCFAGNMLFVLSAVLWIRVFNTINVVGVLRGGGDTTFSMYMEIMSVWGVGVPLAFFGGFYLKIPVYWVFVLVNLEEAVKMAVCLYRMHSGKWIHNLTHVVVPLETVGEQ
jgi:Na+-driven multidrug efflux pump